MMDVSRYDKPAARDFRPDQFRREVFTPGDIFHLARDDALPGIMHLSPNRVLEPSGDPLFTHAPIMTRLTQVQSRPETPRVPVANAHAPRWLWLNLLGLDALLLALLWQDVFARTDCVGLFLSSQLEPGPRLWAPYPTGRVP